VRRECAEEYRAEASGGGRTEELAWEEPSEDVNFLELAGFFAPGTIPEFHVQKPDPYHAWVTRVSAHTIFHLHKIVASLVVAQRGSSISADSQKINAPPHHAVFKDPQHVVYLRAIAHVYPKAKFVWCHRDSDEVVAFVARMSAKSKMEEGLIDEQGIRDLMMAEHHQLGLDQRRILDQEDTTTPQVVDTPPPPPPPLCCPLKVLNGDALEEEQKSPEKSDAKLGSSSSSSSAPPDYSAPPGSRFFDVNLDDTVADPLATVTKIYEHFGWTVSDEYKARLLEWAQNNKRHPLKK
jgi:hypothetical protein